jgi:hypothetical protein
MELKIVIKNLNQILKEKKPVKFDSNWIETNALKDYEYICKNIQTENNDVDWDKVTSLLDRPFQRRWILPNKKNVEPYESRLEVDTILNTNKDKLYTIIAPLNEKDKLTQHGIIISLVRIGQKGNVVAQEEIIKWLTFIVHEWIDLYPQIRKWKGYSDEVDEKIKSCIRCYRYTGSFLNYLFRTLEYSARGKPPLCSLDEPFRNGQKTRVDFFIVDTSA